jgi:hypothetical protein
MTLLAFAALSIAGFAMAPALYAQGDHPQSGVSMMGGMMGRGGMSGIMGRMGVMDHCGGMMRGDHAGARPNDLWRSPRSPDADSKG